MAPVDYGSPWLRISRQGLVYIALVMLGAIILAPFYVVVVLALSSPAEVFA